MLPTTVDADRRRANPSPPLRTTFDARNGELSIAVTARSARSKVDHVMDPIELPLNWTPIQGSERAVPLDWKVISAAGCPSGNRGTFPSASFLIVPFSIFQCAVGTVS